MVFFQASPPRWRWNHLKVNCTRGWKSIPKRCVWLRSWKCLTELKHVVPLRFTSQRHPRCGSGGRLDLCPAGRSDMVRVQEGRVLFSRPPHFRQRLLQTNQHAVVRVWWKCADHRHRCLLRTIAQKDFLSVSCCLSVWPFTISPSGTSKPRWDAVPLPCQLLLRTVMRRPQQSRRFF